MSGENQQTTHSDLYIFQCCDCSQLFNCSSDFKDHMSEQHDYEIYDTELGAYVLEGPQPTEGESTSYSIDS